MLAPARYAIDPASIRERIRQESSRPFTGPGGDEGRLAGRIAIPAAVLIALVARDGEVGIVLTRRTEHLRDHAGQISLPGGRLEEGEDVVTAALREAEEEIGLTSDKVEILGELPCYDTITGFRVHPVVGWVAAPPVYVPDSFEVAEIFELPLRHALDSANHREDAYERDGQWRRYYVLPYGDRHIWGATAGILVGFARLLAG